MLSEHALPTLPIRSIISAREYSPEGNNGMGRSEQDRLTLTFTRHASIKEASTLAHVYQAKGPGIEDLMWGNTIANRCRGLGD